MMRFSRSSIGGLRTARWYLLALTAALATSAGVPTVTVAAAPSPAVPAAGEGFPIPALLGGMVLAFAVGLTAAQVRRRRREATPEVRRRRREATPEVRRRRRGATPPTEPASTPELSPEIAATPDPAPIEPAATPDPPPPEPAAPPRPAPPPPKPAAPKPRPRVVRVEPPRVAPPPPPPSPEPEPDEASWVPPEPVDPAARPAREPAAAPDPALLEAPEAPLPGAAPAADAPEARLDEAPESLVTRPRDRVRPQRPAPRVEPWPDETKPHWTCEIVWRAGYVKSSFRAMAAAPGSSRRRPIAESPPLRWTLMTDPDPPTPEMVAGVRALVDALVADGWERTGSAGPWYAQRFLWRGSGEPGSVVVPAPADAGEASSA